MQNLERITHHSEGESAGESDRATWGALRVLEVLRTSDGEQHCSRHADGTLWRAFPRIACRSRAGLRAAIPARLTSAARAFGDYARRLAALPGPPLHVTLPHFHDFDQTTASVRDAAVEADPEASRPRRTSATCSTLLQP